MMSSYGYWFKKTALFTTIIGSSYLGLALAKELGISALSLGITAAIPAIGVFILSIYSKDIIFRTKRNLRKIYKNELIHGFNIPDMVATLCKHKALAIPMPECWLHDEGSLNAFAVGFSPSNASIAITEGLARSFRITESNLKNALYRYPYNKENSYNRFCQLSGWDSGKENVKNFFNLFWDYRHLVDSMADRAMLAVIAHELSHIANRDTLQKGLLFLAATTVYTIADNLAHIWYIDNEDKEEYDRRKIAYFVSRIILYPWVTIATLLYSQQSEYLADHKACECNLHMGMISTLTILDNYKSSHSYDASIENNFIDQSNLLFCFQNNMAANNLVFNDYGYINFNNLLQYACEILIGSHPSIDSRIKEVKQSA